MTKADIEARAIIEWAVQIHANNPVGSVLTTSQLVLMANDRAHHLRNEEEKNGRHSREED